MTSNDLQETSELCVPLPRVLRIFWAASVAATALMWLIAYFEYRAGWEKLRWYPLLYKTWGDLVLYIPTFRLVHTAAFFNAPNMEMVAYPPFGVVMFAILYSFGHPVGFYLAVAVPALALAVWGVRRAMMRLGISRLTATLFPLTLMLSSFPLARLVPQGNIELFLWIFVVLGIVAYLRGYDDLAAISWGLAGATKLYPVIFLILFIPRQKYRAFFAGVASFVAASVLSMLYLGPSLAVALKGSLGNVFGYQGTRASSWDLREVIANHSSFTLLKFVSRVVGHSFDGLALPYYICGGLLFAAIFFGRVRKLPVVNQLLAVSLFMVMLPTISYYHTLVHLYAPWLLLALLAIRAERAGDRIPGLNVTILLFFPLFISNLLYTFPALFLYGGLIQAALLVLLFIRAVVLPFGEPVALAGKEHSAGASDILALER